MDQTSDPADARPLAPTPGGSLGLLAFGYRGVEAWRAARGTAWIAEFNARHKGADSPADDATAHGRTGTPEPAAEDMP